MKRIVLGLLSVLLTVSTANAQFVSTENTQFEGMENVQSASTQSFSGSCTTIGCTALVKNMIAFSTGTVAVYMDADQTPLNCTLNADGSVILTSSDVGIDRIYSTLLSAQLTGKQVFVRIIDGSSPCHINYARLAQ